MSFKASLVPTEMVAREWHRAAEWLAPAVARSGGRYDMRSLYQAVREGRSDLWFVFDEEANGEIVAAFTTHVARYPLKDILAVDFIGGRGVGEWLTCVTDILDRYVTAHRLAGLETCARTGWKPLLEARGWQQTMSWYERDAPASGAEQG